MTNLACLLFLTQSIFLVLYQQVRKATACFGMPVHDWTSVVKKDKCQYKSVQTKGNKQSTRGINKISPFFLFIYFYLVIFPQKCFNEQDRIHCWHDPSFTTQKLIVTLYIKVLEGSRQEIFLYL